jgi:CubicO group peptidase (beta-lactamase class C family)
MPLLLGLLLGLQNPSAVTAAVHRGISEGVFPGAVVVIGTHDRILLARGYGHFTWNSASRVPDPDSTLFDLASLTKILASTSGLMLLSDRGQLTLDQAVASILPEFDGPGKGAVTVRHLLQHRSGLPAFLRLDTLAPDAETAKRLVMAEPLQAPPGSRMVYSDLNGMLMGWIIERVTGLPLDSFVTRAVFRPLGMTRTRYRPPRSWRGSIAPVGLWHGHPIAGEVHDQNAARLGGISGHAGLYSTGADVARFAQFMLRKGALPDGTQLVRSGTVTAFTRRGPDNRALGWEMRDTSSANNSGHRMSAATFGHTGYTGTSLWIDPEQDVFVVLLTNRVFSPRTGRSISLLKQIRGAVADAAVDLAAECKTSAGCPGTR